MIKYIEKHSDDHARRHLNHTTAERYPVPAVKGNSTRRFAAAVVGTLFLWIASWPPFTLGFLNRYDSSDAAWIQGLYQRKDLSLRRPPTGSGGRIVIVGGSGALFGIDAELIERKLGVTTLNYATHAGLGGYILDRARSAIHPGDTVLLCPEYELWYTPATDLSDVSWAYVCTYDKRYIFSRGIGPGLQTLYSQPGAAYWDALLGWRDRHMGINDGPNGPFNLAMIDRCGDLRGVPPRLAFRPQGDLRFAEPGNPACAVGDYRAFARWARANQVRVLYSWPNMCQPAWPRGAPPGAVVAPASMRALLDELGFIALNEPGDTIFPRDWFTDTPYHADAGCRRVRTEALVRRLRPYFGLPAVSLSNPPSVPALSLQQAQAVYLVGGETNWLRHGNTFADPSVQVKYLSAQRLDCPDAITPADLVALAARGVPIWFDDPAVQALLPAEQWEFAEVDRVRESLGDWLARYDHHLFLIAHAGSVPFATSPAAPASLPPELRAALAGASPSVAFIGTGPWARVRRVRTDARTAILEAHSAALVGHDVPGLALLARADADGARGLGVPSQSRVQANTKALFLAPGGQIAVAVIDPEQGILVDAGSFQGDETKTVWSLRRLSLRPPPAKSPAR